MESVSRKAETQTTADATPITSPASSHKVVTRTDTANGLKPDLTSASNKSPESQDDEDKPNSSSESKPRKPEIVKMGHPRVMPKVTPKPPAKAIAKGPVKKVNARAGHAPTVTRPPKGSKEHKVLEQTTDEPFWKKVKRAYFI